MTGLPARINVLRSAPEEGSLAEERVVRRLAAILVADVAGYSRLMGADEEGTHERLKAHLRQFVERGSRSIGAARPRIRRTASCRSLRAPWTPCAVL